MNVFIKNINSIHKLNLMISYSKKKLNDLITSNYFQKEFILNCSMKILF